jgi:PAS domain S-box-containing protein
MPIREAQVQSLFRTLAQSLLLALVIAAPCAATAAAQQAVENKRVLFLFNNDSFTATQATIERALRSTLKNGSSVPVETYSEYVGNTRVGTGYEQEFVALLRRKYEGKKFDVIFGIGQFPISVLLRNRAELFPGTPIVSLTIDQRLVVGLYPAPGLTGVWGEINFKPTLELALALHPGTKRVVVIQGVSETDKDWATRAQGDFREYESRLEFSYLMGLTVPKMRNALAGLPPDTIVFFVSSIRDNAGNIYESPDYLKQISSASTAPIYGTTDGQLGNGIVGGSLLSFEALGTEGGQVGLRVLAGEKPEAIAPHGIPSVAMFDWRELRRWGISEKALPVGSVVRFKQPSLWEFYKWYIIGAIAAFIIEALLIIWLLIIQRRRRRAERERERYASLAEAEHRHLDETVSNVPGIVCEMLIDPGTNKLKTSFISDYVEKMLGYTAEEWLSSPGFGLSIMPEEDRERATRDGTAVMSTGKEGEAHFRWKAKDGRLLWIEAHLSPILDKDGKIVGLRGVSIDVTERKQAEEALKESENQVRHFVEHTPVAVAMFDQEMRYLLTSRRWLKDNHLGEQDIIGRSHYEVVPDIPERWREGHRRCLAGAVERCEEDILQHPDGTFDWVRWEIRPWYTAGGEIGGIIMFSEMITERKLAEEALKESEARLRLAQLAARVGTWEWDVRTGASVWSEMIWQLLGIEPDDGPVTVERFIEFIHPEDRDRTLRKVNEVIAGGEEYYDEFRIVRGDGRVLWLASKGRLIRSADGRPERMLGANIDITERKLAEEALLMQRELLEVVVHYTPASVCLIRGSDLRLQIVNPSYLAIAPGKEMVGKTLDEIWPETGRNLAATCRRVLETGEPHHVVDEFATIRRTPDGPLESAYFSWSLHRVRLPGDEGWGLLNTAWETTERKQGEEALRESEARFRSMADTAPVMIWVADTDKRCIYVNKSWLNFTGRSIAEELDTGWVEDIHPDDSERCFETFNSAFDGRELFTIEYRLHRADGVFRWVFDTGAPRFSSTGEFLGYIGSCVDITDRKESEVALQTALDEVNRLKSQLQEENIYLREEIKLEHNFSEIIGHSDAIKYVLHKIEQVAPTDSTILIMGETGTGKELAARAIHSESLRRDRPLVKVNCAALSASLIESELFGHEKGAFTGATGRKIGRFELADGATIFLDEIGELPPELQVKLLRVLQEGEFERLGGTRTIKVNVRVIAATNRQLWEEVQKGHFREDLWYRLNVFPITMPPLRQRREDISLLVEHFVNRFSKKIGKKITSVAPATLNSLIHYSWPGNVRELANVIERAVINNGGPVLHIPNISEALRAEEKSTSNKTLEEMEREYIITVLDNTGGRIEGPNGAARILGLHPSTLRTRMAKLKIKPHQSFV